jgi:hypothetical protein
VLVVLGLVDTLEKICKKEESDYLYCKLKYKSYGSLGTFKMTITSFLKLYDRKAEP